MLNNQAYQNITTQAQEVMANYANGKKIDAILAELYLTHLPNKTQVQADLMSQQVLDTVAGFTNAYQQAKLQGHGWSEQQLDEMLAGKPQQERCQILYQLKQAFAQLQSENVAHLLGGESSLEAVLQQLQGSQLDSNFCDDAMEVELRKQLLDTLANACIFTSQLDSLLELAKQSQGFEDLAQEVVRINMDAAEFKSVCAMIAYITAKTQGIEGLSPDITLEEITVAVCAQIEVQNVAQAVAQEGMLVEAAMEALNLLGTVSALYLSGCALSLGIDLAIVLSSNFFLLVGGVLLAGAVSMKVFQLCTQCSDALVRTVPVVAEGVQWVASAVVTGLELLVDYVRETVIPVLQAVALQCAEFFIHLLQAYIVKTDVQQISQVCEQG